MTETEIKRYKETIAFVGPDDSGKTSSLFDYARAHPDDKFFMIDLENKADKIHDGLYPDVTNIEIELCVNYDQLDAAWNRAKTKLKVNDGLMIDGTGKAWEMVQADYERKVNKIGMNA